MDVGAVRRARGLLEGVAALRAGPRPARVSSTPPTMITHEPGLQRRLRRFASAVRTIRRHRSHLQAQEARQAAASRSPLSRLSSVISAVAHVDHAVGGAGDARVVGDDHDRLAALVVAAEQREDLARALAVEVAGRLVGQQHRRAVTSARAMATRCCWPPDTRLGTEPASSARPRSSSSSRRRARASRGDSPASRPGSSTLSATVRLAIRLKNWKTKPTWRRRSSAQAASPSGRPGARRGGPRPPSGRSSPPSRCSRVDLPQPEGP